MSDTTAVYIGPDEIGLLKSVQRYRAATEASHILGSALRLVNLELRDSLAAVNEGIRQAGVDPTDIG